MVRLRVPCHNPTLSEARCFTELLEFGVRPWFALGRLVDNVVDSCDRRLPYVVPLIAMPEQVLFVVDGGLAAGTRAVGVVNQLGSYTVATVARALGKPTYVMAESFKFVREYPLGQEDLPAEYLHHASVLAAKHGDCLPAPRVDYTPPSLITLLFTDLGILTPSAVSDELINLYL